MNTKPHYCKSTDWKNNKRTPTLRQPQAGLKPLWPKDCPSIIKLKIPLGLQMTANAMDHYLLIPV